MVDATDELVCPAVGLALFLVVLEGCGVVFEQHVLDADGVEGEFHALLVPDEQDYLQKLLKIGQTVLVELAVVQQYPLRVVVARLLLYVLGPPHPLRQNLQVFQLAPHLDLSPHPPDDLALVGLLLRVEEGVIFELGDVEVVGEGDPVGSIGLWRVFVGDFGGGVVDVCDGADESVV